jgi:hypothetical protein
VSRPEKGERLRYSAAYCTASYCSLCHLAMRMVGFRCDTSLIVTRTLTHRVLTVIVAVDIVLETLSDSDNLWSVNKEQVYREEE